MPPGPLEGIHLIAVDPYPQSLIRSDPQFGILRFRRGELRVRIDYTIRRIPVVRIQVNLVIVEVEGLAPSVLPGGRARVRRIYELLRPGLRRKRPFQQPDTIALAVVAALPPTAPHHSRFLKSTDHLSQLLPYDLDPIQITDPQSLPAP